MDPLSVTASIIALFQAGGTVSKGLKKIVNLRNAPDILLALNNEVADLHCLVENTDDVLRQHREIIGLEPIACLCRALDKAKRTLLELENLLAYKLTSIRCKDQESHLVLDRSSWLRLESSVQRLKDKIREDKISLSSALSVLTSFTALRSNAQIRDVYILLGTMRLESRDCGTSRIEAAPEPATENEDPSEQALIGSPQPIEAEQGTDPDPDAVTDAEKHASSRDVRLANTASAKFEQHPYITTFEIARNACGSHCNCTCHQTFRFRSPGFLDAVFGSLFLGYQASPWFSQGCRNGRCRRSSTKVQYMFPRWFVKRSVALTIACNQPKGPELILRVLRTRPKNAFVFICAQFGYYDELKRLLENGEASVVDIDEDNQTALSMAIDYENLDVAELLSQAGSDLFHQDAHANQPIKVAWKKLLYSKACGVVWDEISDRLFNLVNGHSHIDMLHFPELTKAYLGLCPQPFDSVLQSTPRVSVDLADDFGRTTLHWASLAGDWEAVEQLTRCGADADRTDDIGRSSLHSSAPGDSRCLELILGAKADVDLKDVKGRTALHLCSAYGRNTTNLDLLMKFGADIEATKHFGLTPLLCAITEDNYLMVSGLLERGANINARDLHGWTCLLRALRFGSHNSLEICLDNADLRYDMKTNDGGRLLHVAAVYADIESLYILKSQRLYELDTAEEDSNGWSAMQLAQYRRLNDEEWLSYFCRPRDNDPAKWFYAFEELLYSITEAQASMSECTTGDASEEEMVDSEVSYSLSDETYEDDEDEVETWEDAQEDLDGETQG